LKKTITALAIILCCVCLIAGCKTEAANDNEQKAAELLAAGPPEIHSSKPPFALGEIVGEPTKDAPWWTLSYGDFPHMWSSDSTNMFAEWFANAHAGYPQSAQGWGFVHPDSRNYILEAFGTGRAIEGVYYDYAARVRFEAAPLDMVFPTCLEQADIDILEAGGKKAAFAEIGRSALVIVVAPDFPVDSLSLEELGAVLSGEITDWSSFGLDTPVAIHYMHDFRDEFNHMLDLLVMKGKDMVSGETEEKTYGMNFSTQTVIVEIPYTGNYGSIGLYEFRSLDWMGSAKTLKIEGIEPNRETIASGEYPLIMGSYALCWEGSVVLGAFLEWCASAEGIRLLELGGFVPMVGNY